MRRKHVLEWEEGPPCKNCGCTLWIIDGDGQGKFWLLCMAVEQKKDCVETIPLPEDLEIINGD
jgi:hypothetical protein